MKNTRYQDRDTNQKLAGGEDRQPHQRRGLLILIGCAVLVTALGVGVAVYFLSSSPEPERQVEVTKAKKKPRKKNRQPKASDRRANVKVANASTNIFNNAELDEEAKLTSAQKALLDELQDAVDDESLRRVARIVKSIQDQYLKGGDKAIPPYMREQAVEALSWFLPDSLAELIGFMADSNPEVLDDVMKNFTEGIDDAEISDRELADIFKKIAPLIEDDDAIDAILMGIENDMRNSVAVDTYKALSQIGSEAIKQRLVESIQDFTGEDDISKPEQLDAWLKENPDDEDDEEFYGNVDKDVDNDDDKDDDKDDD